MATPKKNDKTVPDPDGELDQDEQLEAPGRKKPVDDEEDDFDEPFDDLEYDNTEDYEDEDDDY